MEPEAREELLLRKLDQTRVLFDFTDELSDMRGKHLKTQALADIMQYIATQRGVLTEPIYPGIVRMVRPPIKQLS